uniref:Uncharacterized protein n=1 Tax=Caenorhabditis japonica TaxID=281687 RepID=A0A8R1EB19_CAEJA
MTLAPPVSARLSSDHRDSSTSNLPANIEVDTQSIGSSDSGVSADSLDHHDHHDHGHHDHNHDHDHCHSDSDSDDCHSHKHADHDKVAKVHTHRGVCVSSLFSLPFFCLTV